MGRGLGAAAKLVEIQLDDANRGGLVKDGEAQDGAARRLDGRQKDLAPCPGVMQAAERFALQLVGEFGRRDLDRRGQRAGRHDIDSSGEAVLSEDLAARRQQQGECDLCLLHELAEWRLHPWLDDSDGHGRLCSSRSSAALKSPTLARPSATRTITKSPRPAMHKRPISAPSST
jgi:hypothetical protein